MIGIVVLAKTGRRGKDDNREVKDSSFSTRLTRSQRDKLDWLTIYFRKSIAELIGSWIDSVFAAMGGDLNADPSPKVEQVKAMPEPISYENIGQLVMHNLEPLMESDKFPDGRLKELMGGSGPTEVERLRIALICGLSEEYVFGLPINGGERKDAGRAN